MPFLHDLYKINFLASNLIKGKIITAKQQKKQEINPELFCNCTIETRKIMFFCIVLLCAVCFCGLPH